jgi:RNA polymerase sigma factor (sigma-70 family)
MASSQRCDEREAELLRRCSSGDRRAFDALWESHRDRIAIFAYAHTRDPDEAEDLTQETSLRAWSVICRGAQIAAFGPYVYKIAFNVARDWAERRRHEHLQDLDEEVHPLEASSPTVARAVESRLSWEFILQQLHEVLISAVGTPEAGKLGHLRKVAFMAFYVDSLTLPEVQADLVPLARALGVAVPTRTQLNNWLCRGDILKALVSHLIREHACWIVVVTQKCLAELALVAQEAEIARLRWRDRLGMEEIANRLQIPLAEVASVAERTARSLVRIMSERLKAALHGTRKQPS